jgi:hypothetical protein
MLHLRPSVLRVIRKDKRVSLLGTSSAATSQLLFMEPRFINKSFVSLCQYLDKKIEKRPFHSWTLRGTKHVYSYSYALIPPKGLGESKWYCYCRTVLVRENAN